MKKSILTSILALLITGWSAMGAPDYPDEYLGLPGDNLNLYAVMKLFQESETLEGFERNLNHEDSRINNLDLNGDKMVDYITVSDYVDGEVHNIVLRVFLSQNESQDVAVFIVEQLRNGEVRIQLIGDEALYGKNYIIEPIYGETPNPGYTGRSANTSAVRVVTYNYYDIATWPVISYIYHPRYVVWRSSWYWGYYPVYWDPWRPYYWHFYYGYHYNWNTYYHGHYRPWNHVRWNRYDRYYSKRVRVYSPTVVVNINRGVYRDTYSRPEQRRAGEELYVRTRDSRRTYESDRPAARSESRAVSSRNTTTERRATTAPARTRTETRSTAVRTETSRRETTTRGTATRTAPTRQATTNRSTTVRTEPARREVSTRGTATRTAPTRQATTNRSTTVRTEPARREVSTRSTATRTAPTRQATTNRSTAVQSSRARSNSSSATRVQKREPVRSSGTAVKNSSRSRQESSRVSNSAGTARKSTNAKTETKAKTRRK
ncbi:MAG: hypothetical protein KFF49_07385 [Bacteroidales bacterium]|nr:hypothetical protein [Bacteroidales bacterium]